MHAFKTTQRILKPQGHLDYLVCSSLFGLKSEFLKNINFKPLKQLFSSVLEQFPICQVANGLVLF